MAKTQFINLFIIIMMMMVMMKLSNSVFLWQRFTFFSRDKKMIMKVSSLSYMCSNPDGLQDVVVVVVVDEDS